MAEKKKPETKTCPVCNGHKVLAFGTSEIRCARCKGKGVVRA